MTLDATLKRRLRQMVYLAGFFLTLNTSITAYINSSLVEKFVGEKMVGAFFIVAYVMAIIGAFVVNRQVHRIGIKRVLATLSILVLGSLLALLYQADKPLALITIVLYLTLNYLLTINLDLYLEQQSMDSATGGIRGLYLTLVNLAWVFSPLIAGRLIDEYDFRAVYVFAIFALLPFLLLATRLREVPPQTHSGDSLLATARHIWRNNDQKSRNLRSIFGIDFMLNFFFAGMVIYTPIYLTQHVGFSWTEFGLISTIMLTPYVFLQFGLGHTADKLTGEKEILILGLSIAGLATIALSFINTPTLAYWALALLATRVGAAAIEIMKESYFFKQIDGGEVNTVYIFRVNFPLAYIVAPVIFSVFLLIFPFRLLFLALGLIVLIAGLLIAIRIQDTR